MTEGGRILRIKLRFILNSLGGGGAEKVLVELLKQLDPNEYDIHLLTVAGGVHAASIPSHVHCKQIVSVKVGDSTGRSTIFGDVVIRVNENFAPAMHIDTDESNAAGLCGTVDGEIIA